MTDTTVTVRVAKLFGGSPPIGTVMTVTRTEFLDNLIAQGIVTVVHLPHEIEAGKR
ncbi:hypothetical protein AB0J38_14380 [Streptomyces sp. NPDC050095]|uniref:hypothetical protein n=1 Tax=unclassified Streptomyces TaxID=2593676 RepID=UPI0034194116